MQGAAAVTQFVSNIDYDAKGQRKAITYGNGATTRYDYDPLTLRLTRLRTTRGADGGNSLQDLNYSYDPTGNIIHIRDDAQQTIFFNNRRVEPSNDYIYDATYRLIEASGREHLGQTNGAPNVPVASDAFDALRSKLPQPGDGNAMGRYTERYTYDGVGNFQLLEHIGGEPGNPRWARAYEYNEASLIEPVLHNSNWLSRTTLSGTSAGTDVYPYDAHGNMAQMPHLPRMDWDFHDQLQASVSQVVNNGGTPEVTYYVYDASGQRVRKVTESSAAMGIEPVRKHERTYLGGFELYRDFERDGSTATLERETLHIMDDKARVAMVEIKPFRRPETAHLRS